MKQKKLKSLLACVLVLCMVIGVQSNLAFAQENDDTIVQENEADYTTDMTDNTDTTDDTTGATTDDTKDTDTTGKDDVNPETESEPTKLNRSITPASEITPQSDDTLSGFSAEGAKEYSGPINDSETYSFTGTANPIMVENGSPTIILNGATITATDTPAIWIKAGATVNLQLEGENTLTGGAGYAAICVDPAYNDDGYSPDGSAKLIVSGNGNLTANGGNGDPNSGMFGGGAGIGGNGQNCDGEMGGVDFGIIEFSEQFTGTIKADGGMAYTVTGEFDKKDCSFGGGAGIGSGGFDCANFDWNTVCGRVNIYNGTIVANDGLENTAVGAGIGSGTGGLTQAWYTDFSNVTIAISGGNIVAQGGGLSAGIGGGSPCDGGNINISGGTVVAKAGAADGAMGASGIGGSNDASISEVKISGGIVTATASRGAAGIGGGTNTTYSPIYDGDQKGNRENTGKITISGKKTIVNAYGETANGSSGTYGGAGIGAGYPVANNTRSVAFDISITDGATVNAYGGYHAQAIGYGYRPGSNGQYYTGYGIKLALDDTISLLAINYDYFQPALVAITEYDREPITYGSKEKYLISYVDENKEATTATSSEAKGYLNLEDGQVAEIVGWNYSESKLSINGYKVGTVENMNGNWATLYSTPTITVSYEWATTDNPDDVTAPATDVIKAGTEYTAKEQDASTQGYRFDGWYTNKDCTQVYQDDSVLNSDTTLYGKWEKLYNVLYDSNGGSGTMADNSSPYVYGASVTVMENEFTHENYNFTGWNTASDGGGKNYSAGDNFVIENNVTLYAQWKIIPAPEPEYGSLTVSKTVSGDGASRTKDFSFTVTLEDKTVDGTYGDMVFANGVATFDLKAGESKTASNLPAGVDYTVEESDNEGYTVTVNETSDTKASGKIAANTAAAAAFNNYKAGGGTPDPDPESGRVKITKTVQGEKAPAESVEYAFKIWVRNSGGTAVSERVSYTIEKTDGTTERGSVTIDADGYTFYLKNGESMIFSGITSGRRVEVQETTTGDFTTTTSGLTDGVCVITSNSTHEVAFVNDYGGITPTPDPDPTPKPTPGRPLDDLPQTGDNSNIGLWIALVCFSLFGMAVALFGRKRRCKRRR